MLTRKYFVLFDNKTHSS